MQPPPDDSLRNAEALQKAGDLDAAARLYEDVLRRQPGNIRALEALGLVSFQRGQFAEAERIFAEAMRRMPARQTAAYNRGCALLQLKRMEEALDCFDLTLAGAPQHLGALVNRSVALQALERSEEALADCDRALALNPGFAPAFVNRGNSLLALRRLDEAFAAYTNALAVQSDAPGAEEGRAIVRYERGELNRAPAAFLARLYATFSAYYDEQMLQGLGYCGHSELRRLADQLQPAPRAPLRICDLGCGTGLAGMAFNDLARGGRLDGVDLSPEMLATAKTRGIYDSLVLTDLNAALAVSTEIYDLMLAADTLIYFGDLAPVFRGIAKRLAPGGRFLFTVESADEGAWHFGRGRRYQHARAYLERVSEEAGFSVEGWTGFTLRMELAEPVGAFAVALRRKDSV